MLSLAAQPALAQPPKNEPNRQYPKSSGQAQPGRGDQKKTGVRAPGQNQSGPKKEPGQIRNGGRGSRPASNHDNKRPGASQKRPSPDKGQYGSKQDGGRNQKSLGAIQPQPGRDAGKSPQPRRNIAPVGAWHNNSNQHQNRDRDPQYNPNHKSNYKAPQQPYHSGLSRDRARQLARAGHMSGYKPLPRNVKKHMVQGRPVPRHVKIRHVPPAMYDKLPRHKGYEWRIAGSDLLLVVAGTLIIHEIIENVFY